MLSKYTLRLITHAIILVLGRKHHVAESLRCTLNLYNNSTGVNDTGDKVRVQTFSNKHEERWQAISTKAKTPEKSERVSRYISIYE